MARSLAGVRSVFPWFCVERNGCVNIQEIYMQRDRTLRASEDGAAGAGMVRSQWTASLRGTIKRTHALDCKYVHEELHAIRCTGSCNLIGARRLLFRACDGGKQLSREC